MRRSLIGLLLLGAVAAAPASAERIVAQTTPHLTFAVSLSPDVVRRGTVVHLTTKVIPKKGIHVYAPGSTYRPIALTIARTAAIGAAKTTYPKPSIYFFPPLKEQVPVYSEPFTLKTAFTIGQLPRGAAELKVAGTVTYQACSDRVCFLPQTVPVAWTLPVAK